MMRDELTPYFANGLGGFLQNIGLGVQNKENRKHAGEAMQQAYKLQGDANDQAVRDMIEFLKAGGGNPGQP